MTATRRGRFSWSAFLLGWIIAVALLVGIHVLSPPERHRISVYAKSKAEVFDRAVTKFAAFRDQVKATPFGEDPAGDDVITERAIDFGPDTDDHLRGQVPVGSADVLLLRHSELRRIKPGLDPDKVKPRLNLEEMTVFAKARLSHNPYLENVARVAHQRPYEGWLTADEVERMVERFDALRTVIIYRIGEIFVSTEPGQNAASGYATAEAFVFDAETEKLIGRFAFASTLSPSIDFASYQRDADWFVKKDLLKNLEIVFWTRLQQRMPKAVIPHDVGEIPFSAVALAKAKELAEAGR